MPKSSFSNEFTYKHFAESGKEDEFNKLFDDAARRAKAQFGKKHPLYIGGKEVFAAEILTERSPIDGSVIGLFQKGTRAHARQAIAAASAALPAWSELGYKERADIFKKAATIFSRNKFNLAAILSYENGKSRYESIGEVDEAIDFMRYYAAELEANKGFSRRTQLQQSTAKVAAGFQGAPSAKHEKVAIRLRPFGVFGIIAPFNFPVSISVGMSAGAMLAGNTTVFKPSSSDSMTMLSGVNIYEYFKEAGLPPGVFNCITGPGSEIGDELVTNSGVAGIAFTGSRAVGTGMIRKAYELGLQKTFIVEMGGKNPVIVSKSADLDAAVSGVASAAFGFDGQKCSACSRVYVHESIKEQFVSKLIEKARSFKIGDPISKEVYMGPLINESAFRTYTETVEKAKSTGRVLYGGNKAPVGLNGHYVEPTIIEVRHDSEIVHSELFVPILTIEGFKTFDDALSMANDTEYGLTAGLYTSKRKEISDFVERIEAGTVYVNRDTSATTGAIVGLHTFVGWKGSSVNGKGSGSKFYLQQFMKEQSISITK